MQRRSCREKKACVRVRADAALLFHLCGMCCVVFCVAGLTAAQLMSECESLYISLEKQKRDSLERAPNSNVRWSDSVELHSMSISVESAGSSGSSVNISSANIDAAASILDTDEAIAAAEPTSSTLSDFLAPTEAACPCKCDCVSAAECYCRCESKPPKLKETTATAAASSSSSSSAAHAHAAPRCTCKCYCERPKNWPRGVRYTRCVIWGAAASLLPPASTDTSSSSSAATTTATAAAAMELVRNRLLIAQATPPAALVRAHFFIRKSLLHPSSTASASASSAAAAGGAPPVGMGLFARTAFKKGQRRILDYTGHVLLTDRRTDFKDHDRKRWSDVPPDAFKLPSTTTPAASEDSDDEEKEEEEDEIPAPRNTRYCFPLRTYGAHTARGSPNVPLP